MCAVIANIDFLFLNKKKSLFSKYFNLLEIYGSFKWVSFFDKPWPGICLIIVPILFWLYAFMVKFPILFIISLSNEYERSPIILWVNLLLKSRTGTVFILAPIKFKT